MQTFQKQGRSTNPSIFYNFRIHNNYARKTKVILAAICI